ncbi:uncharacterized protein LOC114330895 isoform X2 [Diabrotica virgifera virgifera]|uniref:Uncharacterized protein n=1 Tax=Diabrotica virgifera virgifera TaxID=50390 RepID=A0ABM5K4H6_DIAVI|nr:uncharacterized protein LOC114330895 isoform X1 [Diabrotica virgifera virgifera]XP_050505091.1 uncharacterized protein LOC114330895 isoform X2 [Diabrotica virgifera virgifera]
MCRIIHYSPSTKCLPGAVSGFCGDSTLWSAVPPLLRRKNDERGTFRLKFFKPFE